MYRLFLFFLLIFVNDTASASESVSGTFDAIRSCDAYRSFAKGTNPDLIKTVPGATYQAIEVNGASWDWIRLEIPDVSPSQRWVARECGVAKIDFHAARSDRNSEAKGECRREAGTYDSYVLALSWQPGFCEHFKYSGKKPECDALESGELVVHHLTLHGLWPNKKECNLGEYKDCQKKNLDLKEETIAQLAPWMPNFIYEDNFGRYEWDKHGTCQSLEDDDYFLQALQLVKQVDASAIGEFIKSHIGDDVTAEEFFRFVKGALGDEVANRVQLVCTKGRYLQDVRINLPRKIVIGATITETLAGAGTFEQRTSKCQTGKIHIERAGK